MQYRAAGMYIACNPSDNYRQEYQTSNGNGNLCKLGKSTKNKNPSSYSAGHVLPYSSTRTAGCRTFVIVFFIRHDDGWEGHCQFVGR